MACAQPSGSCSENNTTIAINETRAHLHHSASTRIVPIAVLYSKLVEGRRRRRLIMTLKCVLKCDLEQPSLEVRVYRCHRVDPTKLNDGFDCSRAVPSAQEC